MKVHNTHHHGCMKARERYATGGSVKDNFPGAHPWVKDELEHSAGKLASGKTPMGFNVGTGIQPSENEAIKAGE